MAQTFPPLISLLGRILLAVLFAASGAAKITKYSDTVAQISSRGLPAPEAGAVAACALELLGALSLVFGWKVQWTAFALAGYSIVTAVVFHNFWAASPDELAIQQVQFLKNLSITGGLLTLATWGAGAWSLDAFFKR